MKKVALLVAIFLAGALCTAATPMSKAMKYVEKAAYLRGKALMMYKFQPQPLTCKMLQDTHDVALEAGGSEFIMQDLKDAETTCGIE